MIGALAGGYMNQARAGAGARARWRTRHEPRRPTRPAPRRAVRRAPRAQLLPGWLTSCLLVVLLALLTWQLLRRGSRTWQAETREQERQEQLRLKATAAAAAAHRRVWGSAAGDDVREPLLLGACSGGGAAAAGDGRGSLTTRSGPGKPGGGGERARPGAWVDCVGGGDQGGAAGLAPAGAVDVLPVPPHLQPVAVGAVQQQAQHAHRDGALAQDCPRSSGGGGSASGGGGQVALALPRAPLAPGGGAAPAARRRGCCGCLDPARLDLASIEAYERRQVPWQSLVALALLAAWVVGSDTLKASRRCGSPAYWAAALSVVAPAGAVTLLMRQWLLARTAAKAAADDAAPEYEAASPPPEHGGARARSPHWASSGGGVRWTPRSTLLYPLLCSAAGVVAGLFGERAGAGAAACAPASAAAAACRRLPPLTPPLLLAPGVGGGIVKAPLMLALGVCPEVAAATSSTMIFFTAGSAALVYAHFGALVLDYAAALCALGFAATLAGQLATTRLVRALGRRSIIVLAMATLTAAATVAAGYAAGVALGVARGRWWEWGSICPAA
ncbi:sulfite exporter TauE/SafE family protein 5 [Scenedesmus sp. PABB004]|nr:sulfite exporter TauE/SafE family protein 5 [Scenedesmus sp. PABB004]